MKLLLSFLMVLMLSISAYAGEIHQAATDGNLELVKSLLQANPELISSVDNTGKTPLHMAAYNGQVEIAKLLIDRGADLNARTLSGSTPLNGAGFYGHLEAVKLLVERGANINSANNYGFTPLLSTVAGGYLDIVKYLIDHGADINATTTPGNSNALLMAGSSGNNEMVDYFLSKGFDINYVSTDGEGLVHYAAFGGNLELLKELKSKGADLDRVSNAGVTPFLYAAQGNHLEEIKFLMENGANLSAKDSDNETALHKLIGYSNSDSNQSVYQTAKYLIDNGVDPNMTDNSGHTPLHWTIYRDNIPLIEYLVSHGADINATTRTGLTTLHDSIKRGKVEIIEKLIELGAATDIKEPAQGLTPLHEAALKGNLEVVKTVLQNSRDINVGDNDGHTPIYYAGKYGHKQVADYFKSKGASDKNIEKNYSSVKELNKKLDKNEALLWYLEHVGWAIKTQNHLLIFDYWTRENNPTDPCLANGHLIPEELKGQNIELFVTHEHQDHYDADIFELKEKLPNLNFIFGFHPEDLPETDVRGYAGQPYEYIDYHQTRTIDGMTITPIQANDAGQGFLVEVDGLTIYHAGDHAGWREGQKEGFTSEIDFLAEKTQNPDFAFVNVTGCHVQDTVALAEGTFYTIDKLNPQVLVPTHGADRENVYKEYADKIRAKGYKLEVLCAEHRGDKFVYKNDQIM